MSLDLLPNRKYPNIPAITDDPASHTDALRAIVEALNIGQRRTKDILNSFVRVDDLVDLGLINLQSGNFATAPPTYTPSAHTHDHGSELTGLGDNDHPQYVLDSGDTMTGTLNTRDLLPTSSGAYNLGSDSLKYQTLFSNTGRVLRSVGAGTRNVTVGATSSAISCNVVASDASSVATLNIGSLAGAINECLTTAVWAGPASASSTVEILGTSGTNLGSCINVLGDVGAVGLLRFTAASSGSMNLGSVVMETGATATSIIISGDGVFNAGNARGTGGTVTLSGDTVVNLGTLLGGTLTISGNSSFNMGTITGSASATISGLGSYNLARISAGTLSVSGDGCFNYGAISDAGSTITLAGNNTQNSMTVNTGADVASNVAAVGTSIRGYATGSSTVSANASGATVQGYFLGRATVNVTASGAGSFLSAAVDQSAAGSTPGTVTLTAGGAGAVLLGSVSSAAAGTGAASILASGAASSIIGSIVLDSAASATISATNTGSSVQGTCQSGTITATGIGAQIQGYAAGTSTVTASGNGSKILGYATATSSGASNITSSGTGNTVIGTVTNTGTGTGTITTGAAVGSVAIGMALTGGSANATISSTAQGSIAIGYASRNAGVSAVLEATSAGSLALGAVIGGTLSASTSTGAFARGYASGSGIISSTGSGAEASGRAVAGATLLSSGFGSLATGYCNTNNMTASGNGSFAQGDSTGGAISATAANAVQFGVGANGQADSVQVGTSIRMKGTVGAFAAPANGDQYLGGTGNAFQILHSNGKAVQINTGAVGWTVGTYGVRRSFAGLTAVIDVATAATAVGELRELLETLVEELQAANHIN